MISRILRWIIYEILWVLSFPDFPPISYRFFKIAFPPWHKFTIYYFLLFCQ
jgi:hypothetical protein